jgi:hypothetical protein
LCIGIPNFCNQNEVNLTIFSSYIFHIGADSLLDQPLANLALLDQDEQQQARRDIADVTAKEDNKLSHVPLPEDVVEGEDAEKGPEKKVI